MSTGSVPNSSWHPSDLAVVTRLGLLSLLGYPVWGAGAACDHCPLRSVRPWPALACLLRVWKQKAVWTSATCSG